MADPRASALYKELLGKLNEASNLSELAEAMLESGNFDQATAYNAQVKVLQDEVKAALAKSNPQ